MNQGSGKLAVVLLSGGLDSATVLAVAVSQGYRCHALTFVYGQRHGREAESAQHLSSQLGTEEHTIIDLDPRFFTGSALTSGPSVPLDRPLEVMSNDIPVTYVPARNTVFLSLALAYAESRGAFDLFIGVNAVDYSGYPDCRPEYIQQFEKLANLATKAGVTGQGRFRVHTPLIRMTKSDIVKLAVRLGVDMSLTWSCYDPTGNGRPCMHCDACLIRKRAFEEAGVTDPLTQSDDRRSQSD